MARGSKEKVVVCRWVGDTWKVCVSRRRKGSSVSLPCLSSSRGAATCSTEWRSRASLITAISPLADLAPLALLHEVGCGA